MAPVEIVLKITLRHIRPPIWRRVRVAGDMSLGDLHGVIQAAMGWQEAHLHEFRIGDRLYGEPLGDADWPDERPLHSEWGTQLDQLIEAGVKRFLYIYDFGDGWEHEVLVEKVRPLDAAQQYPSLITGKRSCPPEDCGGVPGYLWLLEVLADPDHEEHDEITEWVDGDLDPERFEREPIDRALSAMARQHRRPARRR